MDETPEGKSNLSSDITELADMVAKITLQNSQFSTQGIDTLFEKTCEITDRCFREIKAFRTAVQEEYENEQRRKEVENMEPSRLVELVQSFVKPQSYTYLSRSEPLRFQVNSENQPVDVEILSEAEVHQKIQAGANESLLQRRIELCGFSKQDCLKMYDGRRRKPVVLSNAVMSMNNYPVNYTLDQSGKVNWVQVVPSEIDCNYMDRRIMTDLAAKEPDTKLEIVKEQLQVLTGFISSQRYKKRKLDSKTSTRDSQDCGSESELDFDFDPDECCESDEDDDEDDEDDMTGDEEVESDIENEDEEEEEEEEEVSDTCSDDDSEVLNEDSEASEEDEGDYDTDEDQEELEADCEVQNTVTEEFFMANSSPETDFSKDLSVEHISGAVSGIEKKL